MITNNQHFAYRDGTSETAKSRKFAKSSCTLQPPLPKLERMGNLF